jgi:outer membrane protein assembly factor BamD
MYRVILFIIILIFVFSCSSTHKNGVKINNGDSEFELYSKGVSKFEKKDYDIAIEKLEKLLNDYPLSKYSVNAELLIANSHFALKEYLEATESYKEFYKLHPIHEKIPFVIFRIAEGYYLQSPRQIDRDQTNLENASNYLNELIVKFPNSSYAQEANVRKNEIRIKFAKRIQYVGNFYIRKKIYNACVLRFSELKEKYDDLGFGEEAMYKKAYCLLQLNKKDEATVILNNLSQQNKNSEFGRKAVELIKH